jgi:hypothetical protein
MIAGITYALLRKTSRTSQREMARADIGLKLQKSHSALLVSFEGHGLGMGPCWVADNCVSMIGPGKHVSFMTLRQTTSSQPFTIVS